jgi:uncharacterized SAM-binding protein YcdF (DUF218 family)
VASGVRARRRRYAALGATVALVVAGAGVGLSDLPPSALVVEDTLEPADAVLVMTGDPGFERTKAAAGLVTGGMAPLLVLTGGDPWPGDSAESLRKVALERGVRAEQIRLEDTSHGTRESLLAVEPLLRRENVRSLILVTSPYHQRRASLAARHALPGIRIVDRPVRDEEWPPVRPWWRTKAVRRIVISEYGKLLYYGLRGWL